MPRLIRVASLSDIPEGGALCVRVGDEPVGLFRSEGQIYALGDRCTHVGAPLSEGVVHAGEVECPLHDARFDLATGRALSGPAPLDTPVYRVRLAGDDVLIEEPAALS
ncbi:MAG: non-heme iron oxygenase ferredoxin subunit [Planctomycetota bacterium]